MANPILVRAETTPNEDGENGKGENNGNDQGDTGENSYESPTPTPPGSSSGTSASRSSSRTPRMIPSAESAEYDREAEAFVLENQISGIPLEMLMAAWAENLTLSEYLSKLQSN